MPTSAGFALQQAVFTTLSAAAPVTSLLGPAKIFDDVPQSAAFPYLSFGQTSASDWGTGTEDGEEHTLTLHVWSREGGKKQVEQVLAAIRTSLHDQNLSLSGHRLINLRQELAEHRREPDGETIHGIARYRAVTEPL